MISHGIISRSYALYLVRKVCCGLYLLYSLIISGVFVDCGPFSWQGAGRSSCGSSCSSNWRTRTASTSSRGRAIIGSSSCPTQTRWRGAGASARTSPRWTTRNYRAACVTITTRTSYTRRPASATCTGSCATCRDCWDTRPTSCSRPAESRRSGIKRTSECRLTVDQMELKYWTKSLTHCHCRSNGCLRLADLAVRLR